MNKNLKKVIAPVAAAAMVFAVPTGVYAEDGAQEKITFCLDWTPNTNHTGLYVAQAKGYYEEAGLDVEIVQPPENGAALMCAAGQAQFAIEAQDTMAASLALDEPLGITAVAGIIQHNTSGILSRKGDGIDKPAGLTGKTYSTWDSPIELAMLENVVNGDGGDFSQVTLIPNDITDEPAALAANQTDDGIADQRVMLLQQLEIGFVFRHQLYRDPDITEGFAITQVVGDDVGIERVVGETRLGSPLCALGGRLIFSQSLLLQGATAQ